MEFNDEVKNWIIENTETKDHEEETSFTTSRDSKKTALKWREELDIQLAKVCSTLLIPI